MPMRLGDENYVTVSGSIPRTVSIESTAASILLVESASRFCVTKKGIEGGVVPSRTIALNDACTSDETASLQITVRASTEGSSDLLIKESDDSVWASVSLSVERATSLALTCNTSGSVTLALPDSCLVKWKATDANGQALMSSTSGIYLKSSNPAVVKFQGYDSISSEMPADDCLFGSVSLLAVGPGDATVTATGGGATETLAVHVTP